MATIELEKIVKRYGKVEAVKGIDLSIADGEFVVFVGRRAAASRRRSG
jgi:multiple sugar transport system ATP-binding protein